MRDDVVLTLAAWQSFYVIMGSSAAALTGLQFVVIALSAERRLRDTTTAGIDTFLTPTIMHFCAVLLLSAILSTPWHTLLSPALAIGACGIAGIGYVALVIRRARQLTAYRPVLEDWIWHAALPFIAYATLLIAAVMSGWHGSTALFMISAAALLLLFTGIHNAWDVATYLIAERPRAPDTAGDRK